MSKKEFNDIVKQFETPVVQPYYVDQSYIAFILDGKVQFVLGTDLRFSAILQSEPIIVDISDHPQRNLIHDGALYDEKTGEITPNPNIF